MTDEWLPGSDRSELVPNVVQVWRASIASLAPSLPMFEAVLAEDELARAGRFFFEKDRIQSIVSRGLLRTLLGQYLDIEPAQLTFQYTELGKPSLSNQPDPFEPLEFNLSHSGDMILCAFALDREVGIDVEHIRGDFEGERIANDLFSTCEKLMLAAMPEPQRRESFFVCWTCKEAYIKARGMGLSMPLNEFDVSSAMDEGKTVMYDSTCEKPRWWVRRFSPGPHYAGAVAGEGRYCQFQFYDFQPEF